MENRAIPSIVSGDAEPRWQPIETAVELDRVIVAGWSKATPSCQGYWWYHDDVIVDGKPSEHPDAKLWHPYPPLPPDPEVN